jgi:UDP-3-O-[3-hydroxymyristoyl] glucosamine N-acyltransferase
VDPGARVVGSPAQPLKDYFRQIAKLKKLTKREG